MGFGGSSVKKCTLEVPVYRENLNKQTMLIEVLDMLAQNLTQEKMSASMKFPRIPVELAADPSALIGRTDFAQDNAVTRYNSFVGLYNQLKPADRLEQAQLTFADLMLMRDALTTQLANMCS
jgi:hypothetical protein